jgi:hypothetical protein
VCALQKFRHTFVVMNTRRFRWIFDVISQADSGAKRPVIRMEEELSYLMFFVNYARYAFMQKCQPAKERAFPLVLAKLVFHEKSPPSIDIR